MVDTSFSHAKMAGCFFNGLFMSTPISSENLVIMIDPVPWMERSSESHDSSSEAASRPAVTEKEVVQATVKFNAPASAIKI